MNDKQKSEVLAGVDYSKLTQDTKEDQFTLGEGQVRYDASGRVIASGPPKTRTTSTSDQIKLEEKEVFERAQRFELNKGIRDADTVLADLELGEEGELAGVFGRVQQFIPEVAMEGQTAFLYNKLNQIKQSIVIVLRAKLRGQGTITDNETVMLERASTAISRNLDIADIKSEVEEFKAFFEFQLTQYSNSVEDEDPLGVL